MQNDCCQICGMTSYGLGSCQSCGGATYPVKRNSADRGKQSFTSDLLTILFMLAGLGFLMQISALFL